MMVENFHFHFVSTNFGRYNIAFTSVFYGIEVLKNILIVTPQLSKLCNWASKSFIVACFARHDCNCFGLVNLLFHHQLPQNHYFSYASRTPNIFNFSVFYPNEKIFTFVFCLNAQRAFTCLITSCDMIVLTIKHPLSFQSA